MRFVNRSLKWIAAISMVAAFVPNARAQSLLDWLANRQTNVVNVYVPPGAVTTVPSTTVPSGTVVTGSVVTARPIIVIPPNTAAVAPTTVVPTTTQRPIVGGVTTALQPVAPAVAPAAPVISSASVAQGYTVQYRARTRYRTRWIQVPVTVYRPTISVDPVSGAQTTALRACQTHTWQVRRVPITEWRPLRVLPGPPPAGSIPTVSLPTQQTITTPGAPTAGWPSVTPSAPYPNPTVPTGPTSNPPVIGSPPSTSPSLPSANPPASSGNGGLETPSLTPGEAQQLQKPSTGTNADPGAGGDRQPANGSTGGPQIVPPTNGNQPANGNAGANNRSRSGLQPIPRDLPASTPRTSPARSPQDLEEPPQLLDPRDSVAARSARPTVVRTSYRPAASKTANGNGASSADRATARKIAHPKYDASGWESIGRGE